MKGWCFRPHVGLNCLLRAGIFTKYHNNHNNTIKQILHVVVNSMFSMKSNNSLDQTLHVLVICTCVVCKYVSIDIIALWIILVCNKLMLCYVMISSRGNNAQW